MSWFIDIHLVIVHFAIALLTLASIGLWIVAYKPNNHWLFATDLALTLGTLAAVIAIMSGAFAFHHYDLQHAAQQLHRLKQHRFWAMVTVCFYATALIWRAYQILQKKPTTLALRIITSIGLAALILTGYYSQFLLQ